MHNINFLPTVIIVVDWLIKILVFNKLSNSKFDYKKSMILVLIILAIYLVNIKVAIILEPFYLLIFVLVLLRPNWRVSQIGYYSFFPFVLIDLTQRVTGVFEVKYLLLNEPSNNVLAYIVGISFLLVLFFAYNVLIKIIGLDFSAINQMFFHKTFSKAILFLNISFVIYVTVLHWMISVSDTEQDFTITFATKNTETSLNLLYFYLVILFAGLFYLNYKSKDLLSIQLQKSKDSQLEAL